MTTSTPNTPSPPFAASKSLGQRHSISIVTGPKPLRLLDPNRRASTPPDDISPGVPTGRSSTTPLRSHLRGQSSISYFPGHGSRNAPSPPLEPRHVPPRPRSTVTGPNSPLNPLAAEKQCKSAGSTPINWKPPERLPATITENHVELLQSIAKKEATCLELRSQLAAHEAELLQLKQKWERIVHHRFVKENAATGVDPNPNLAVLNNSVLEGIKEGIKEGMEGVSKGVGRLISAGISELAPSQTPPSSIPPSVTSRTHSSNSSASTITTTTGSSVRLSQSSFSSWDDDPWAQPQETCDQSPTPSTNDDRVDCEKDKEPAPENSGIWASPSPDVLLSPSAFSFTAEFVAGPSSNPTRAGTNTLPPPSSIPGVGSFVGGTGAIQPVSSLVTSATRKWNELQRTPTFAKGQKRASSLFSGVTQSIASLVAPFPPSAPNPTPSSPQKEEARLAVSASLLDCDDETLADKYLGSVLTPSPKALEPKRRELSSDPDNPNKVATEMTVDQDEEDAWKW